MSKETNIQDLIVSNPQIKSSALKLESVKSQLDSLSENCLKIKVVDDASLSVMELQLSKLNSLVNSVEDIRVAEKKPYLDAGKAIDNIAKYITSNPEKAIAHLKNEKLEWIRKIELERKKKEEAKSKYEQVYNWLSEKTALASKPEHCEIILDKIKGFEVTLAEKGKEVYLDYFEQLTLLVKEYKTLVTEKFNKLSELAKLDVSEEEANAIKENIAKLQDEVKQSVESAATLNVNPIETKIKKVTKKWTFELVDIKKVPLAWLTIDEDKIKEYMDLSKDSLTEGQVINGIKFFRETRVSA